MHEREFICCFYLEHTWHSYFYYRQRPIRLRWIIRLRWTIGGGICLVTHLYKLSFKPINPLSVIQCGVNFPREQFVLSECYIQQDIISQTFRLKTKYVRLLFHYCAILPYLVKKTREIPHVITLCIPYCTLVRHFFQLNDKKNVLE